MDRLQRELPGGDYGFLRKTRSTPIQTQNAEKTVRLVDLFCGCGGISLGVQEACNTLGYGLEIALAVDFEKEASQCYKKNFPNSTVLNCDIGELFSCELGVPLSEKEIALKNSIGKVDLLVGGPPCQGHSDLNRYTRRNDPKNRLYQYMARAAEVLTPEHIIIENVVGAIHDKGHVVQTVEDDLARLGYRISVGFVDLVEIGVPQTRRRLILVGSKKATINVENIQTKFQIDEKRTVKWAIEDLVSAEHDSIVDTPSVPSKDNQRRIHYLFEHDLYDLPNEERPPCHRNKKHSYNSIYGRLHWDRPSQTITSGFYSTCIFAVAAE